jgi:hypothetical protein
VKKFIAHHAAQVSCTLSGFDRLVFRGTLLPLMPDHAMFHFLKRAGVRLLDFADYVSQTSERVKEAALAEAEKQNRPVIYLESPKTSKEDLAKQLLAAHPLDKPGLVCAFKAVEPCMSFEYHRSQDPKERGLKLRPRKCLHIYKYFVHPSFGFMNARIQTWFPFNMQVCLAFATVTSERFSIPPLMHSHRRNSVVSLPRSAVSFASSVRTESSRRSPRRTATNSPNAAVS